MSLILLHAYRLAHLRLSITTRPLSIMLMSAIGSRNSQEFANLLIPSKESLDKLCLSELTTFSDSQEAEIAPDVSLISEDPFDPEDLIGIVIHDTAKESILSKPETSNMKNEPSTPPRAISSPKNTHIRSPSDLRVTSARKVDGPLTSVQEPLVKSEFSPLARLTEFKKPKLFSSSPVRQFSTSVSGQGLYGISHEHEASPKANASHIQSAHNNKRSRLQNLPNPTIQLATQRPLAGTEDEIGEDGEAKKIVKPIILSAEQEYVLQLAKRGKSIFFTGSAGTGKSVLLRSIIKELKYLHGKFAVAVTASTGLAACNIGGITVHSFAGFGLGKGSASNLLKSVRRNRKATLRWNSTKVLVIDEISMIDGALFQNLDYIARKMKRKEHIPFGGIQLIVCGDFYQLPPVSKTEYLANGSEVKQSASFAFECDSWDACIKSKIILKEVFRQKGDQTFIKILNDMRHGIVSADAEKEFDRLNRPLSCAAGIVPTELYATRYEVDSANNMKLNRLRGNARVFEAKDSGSLPPNIRASVLSNFLAPQNLYLKINAQVMCLKNFDDTLVNGTLGKVVGFLDRDTYMCSKINREEPDLDFADFKKKLIKEKVELVVSKRETVLGEKLDLETKREIKEEVENALQTLFDSVFNFFDEDTEHPESKGDQESSVIANEDRVVSPEEAFAENRKRKLEFMQQVRQASKGEKYPLVRFLNPDGVTTRDVLVEPEQWDINDEQTNEVFASRVQLPLMLAWALSIHKSQGQTLQKVKVDLTRIFETGQAYVALSRAVSREGLQVINFSKLKVRTHTVVEKFYETLSTTEDLAKTGKD